MTDTAGRALAALRAATRAQHEAIEARLPIARPGAGRAEYAQHVAAVHAWLSGIDDRDWDVKREWLREDIAVARADGYLAKPVEAMPAVPFATPAERMGWAYVIEGSMLGGRVLHERLSARLAPWPARYLLGRGAQTGAHWRGFLARLERELRTDEEISQAARGACEAFRSLDRWFERLMRAQGLQDVKSSLQGPQNNR